MELEAWIAKELEGTYIEAGPDRASDIRTEPNTSTVPKIGIHWWRRPKQDGDRSNSPGNRFHI